MFKNDKAGILGSFLTFGDTRRAWNFVSVGHGDVDFDGIFETLRGMDFANKQLKKDAPKVGGDNIACVSYFGFPEKMNIQAPEARERIERELLAK